MFLPGARLFQQKHHLHFPPPLPPSFIKLATTTDSLELLVKDNDHERHSLSMEQE